MANLKVSLPGLEMKIPLFQRVEHLGLDMSSQSFMISIFLVQ